MIFGQQSGNVSVRPQSCGEEIANSISHGVGFLIAAAFAPVLIVNASGQGNTADVFGAVVFAVAMLSMYLASTLYHALPQPRVKRFFRLLDHCAIYLLIAGTYTPFTLGVLSGIWGWSILGIIWSIALAGIVMKIKGGVRYTRVSTILYLAMGWLVVVAARPLWENMDLQGLLWLAAGGIAYSVGVVFYAIGRKIRYGHFIWHLFVIAGTACHFIAVLGYAR